MRSTVAALCLLFVTGFLREQSEPRWRDAVARAALANGVSQHAVSVEQVRSERDAEPKAAVASAVVLPARVVRALAVGRGGLPPPRAPDSEA